MPREGERGWLADFIYCGGSFRAGLAMFADAQGRITRFSAAPDDFTRVARLSRRAILPGLVNVHSHSFQRAIRARTEHRTPAAHDTFWTWREGMYRAANMLSPEDAYDVARMSFLEMLLSGITTVGEFHYLHHGPGGRPYEERNLMALQIVRAASEVGLRIALLRTAYVRAGWRREPNPLQNRFLTPDVVDFVSDTENLGSVLGRLYSDDSAWVGVAPHSVRAVPLGYLLETMRYASTRSMPVHMHVAEQPAEVEQCLAEHGVTPVELLRNHQLLDAKFTAVHAIHLEEHDIESLAKTGARVCACPTTERNLGDGIGPYDRFADAGVAICCGSDSNVQIDLLEDARQLEYHLRLKRLERVILSRDSGEGLAQRLIASVTENGAESVHAPGGKLEVGRTADFVTVDLDEPSLAGADANSLLGHIVFSAGRSAMREVFVGGQPVIRQGRHLLQEEIVRRFGTVQQRLWGSGQ
ncbi:MAG: formimidoylglutamate deiminase [Candidatus Acidiferrales bacterium]